MGYLLGMPKNLLSFDVNEISKNNLLFD